MRAPRTKWMPEDDFILKDAVEKGASLEALAKGARPFSRRFTLRQLRERWYCLLYDSETSAEASARIIEIEIESSPLKTSHNCSCKGNDSPSGKRKVDCVRSHYYAKRKRISNEPGPINQAFVVQQDCSFGSGNGYECEYQLNFQSQHSGAGASLRQHFVNCYGLPEAGYGDKMPTFSSLAANRANANNVLPPDCVESFPTEHLDDMMDQDCGNGYRGNTLQSIGAEELENVHQPFEGECTWKEPLKVLRKNLTSLDNHLGVHETKPAETLPTNNLCNDRLIEVKSLPSPGPSNGNHRNFTGNTNVGLQVSESADSFHQLGCSSPEAGLPLWETDPVGFAETMPMGMHSGSEEILKIPDNNINAPGCEVETSEASLNDGQPDAGLGNHAILSESSLMDVYMDFSDDEGTSIFDVGHKHLVGTSCQNGLNPILSSSSIDGNQDDLLKLHDLKAAQNLEATHVSPDEACCGGANKSHGQKSSDHDPDRAISVSGENVSSPYLKLANISEPLLKFEVCILNTEDPEIPDNEDVFIPTQLQPQSSTPISLLFNDRKCPVGKSTMLREEQVSFAQTSVSVVKAKSSSLLNVGSAHSADNCIVHDKFFESDLVAGVPMDLGIAAVDRIFPMLQRVAPRSTPDAATHSPSLLFGHARHNTQRLGNGCKKEMNMQVAHKRCESSHSELVSVAPISTGDQEEHVSDIEDDVPSFSDVEAMILDMDLGTNDQNPCFFTEEVSRYQFVHSRKAIIRLEQGARAYMNRAVLWHRAFAVFYGRHLKYFIRTSEVSLGRGTEDVKVDIDLGREGRANKISRRQAIIKMDEDGSFILKNIGKCSIIVNSKEVAAKKRVNLSSGSLLEIKGLRFIFEVNQGAVKRYVIKMNSGGENTGFEGKPKKKQCIAAAT